MKEIKKFDEIPCDAVVVRQLQNGATLFASPTEGAFRYYREGSSSPVGVEITRPATSEKPAIVAHVADRGKLAEGAITVGLDRSQESAARDLLAQAKILRETGNSRLKTIAERLERRAEDLTATVLTMARGDKVAIGMGGKAIDGSAIAVAAVRAHSENGFGKTAVAMTPKARARLVEEIALETACQDARNQPKQSLLSKAFESIRYVKSGGERPDDCHVRGSNERFAYVKELTRQRIGAQLRKAVEFVIPKPDAADLQAAREELGPQIEAARQEAEQEAARISDWVDQCVVRRKESTGWGPWRHEIKETEFHDRPVR